MRRSIEIEKDTIVLVETPFSRKSNARSVFLCIIYLFVILELSLITQKAAIDDPKSDESKLKNSGLFLVSALRYQANCLFKV